MIEPDGDAVIAKLAAADNPGWEKDDDRLSCRIVTTVLSPVRKLGNNLGTMAPEHRGRGESRANQYARRVNIRSY
jgi:hypothetical protein